MGTLACVQRGEDLFLKTRVVHIFAWLRQSFRCTLFRAKKEIIHVDDGAVIYCFQHSAQSRLSGGAGTVNGYADRGTKCQLPVDSS